MATPTASRESIVKLAALVRSLFDHDEYKHAAHYSALMADLMTAHDARNAHPKGSPDWYRLHDAATKVYHAANSYALKWNLTAPNEVLRESGYTV
jgi:hypothetical protein